MRHCVTKNLTDEKTHAAMENKQFKKVAYSKD